MWAIDLGPEVFGPWGDGQPTSPSPKPKPLSGERDKPQFPAKKPVTIDEEIFLASFRRQSRAKLLRCLEKELGSPNSLLLSADLGKGGHLTHVMSMSADRPVPDCAKAAIYEMDFSPLTIGMEVPLVTVQWRVDW
jgi:hypothetical protein